MKLKSKRFNKMYKLNIKFSSKNLFIFLVSFTLITFILGIIFFLINSSSDKSISLNNITSYFNISNSYNYVSLLKSIILSKTFNIFLIWILGISVIGILASIFLYFCEIFSIGYNLCAIFYKYKIKGILASFCYMFPSKLCYIILLFFLTFFSIKISYKIIRLIFGNYEINLKKEKDSYFKVLLISFIGILVISVLEVFVDPFFIKFFTNI